MSLHSTFPILTFHTLDDQESTISFPPHLFRRGMARLFENGYRAIGLDRALEHVQTGTPFPLHAFVITFDDGYQSVFREAFSFLREYAMPATVFLTVGPEGASVERLPSLNSRLMLSWDEIHEMHRSGITFGAHALRHTDLTRLEADQVETEMRGSKQVIEEALGDHVSSFAYPFGRYDDCSRALARKYFDCACSDRLGLIHAQSDPYALERIDAYYLRDDRLFALLRTGLFPWYILSRRIPRQINRLIQHWRAE